MAILVKNLKKKVLENAKESDQIIIITGYFSPDMIDEIAKMGVPFVYYYGMYGIDCMRYYFNLKLYLGLIGMVILMQNDLIIG